MDAGSGVDAVELTDGAGYLGYTGGWGPVVALADELEAGRPGAVRELQREAHRAGLVTSFDWPTWMTGRGRELAGDLDEIGRASLEECRRLLVAHLRRDRFVHGHLQTAIERGDVPALLRRAGAITAAKAEATAAAKRAVQVEGDELAAPLAPADPTSGPSREPGRAKVIAPTG